MRNALWIGVVALTLGVLDAPALAQSVDGAAPSPFVLRADDQLLLGSFRRSSPLSPTPPVDWPWARETFGYGLFTGVGCGALVGTFIGVWPDGMTVGYGASRGAVYGVVPGLLLGYMLYRHGRDNK